QDEIDKIVSKRSEKARTAQKQALKQLEQIQNTVKMSEEEKDTLEAEIEKLRKQTLTSEEIAKREAKKAKDTYESQLTDAQKQAERWEKQYKGLKVNYEITTAAQKHGVLPQSLPFLESFLSPKMTLSELKDEDTGELRGHEALVDFTDIGADGKPVQVQLTVEETVKRMKELPESYGQLFSAPSGGGMGGTSGKPGNNK